MGSERTAKTELSRARTLFAEEWPLAASLFTAALFSVFGPGWLAELSNPWWLGFMLAWLFVVILLSAFAIVRHAESLAHILGEPFGTLVLTLSVIGVEVLMISAVMLTGEGKPTIARDTMFSVVMILLGGMTGFSLLLGGLRYHEQTYNLQGANAYLALIIPLAVLGLVLPNFTTSVSGPAFSPFQSVFVSLMSVGIYIIFLAVQTRRHRDFFIDPTDAPNRDFDDDPQIHTTREDDVRIYASHEVHTSGRHAVLLIAYILPLVLLAKRFAVPLDYATVSMNAPAALSGFLVAVLILAPEAISAVRAAARNHLQRSVNILLGSVLATIGLTIPAVLSIGLATGATVHLGLQTVDAILLLLLLAASMLTFSNNRTNALLGAVHLLIFLAFFMLVFER